MTLHVDLVVSGGVGDLLESMLHGMRVTARSVRPITVVSADEIGVLVNRLDRAAVDWLSIREIDTRGGQ